MPKAKNKNWLTVQYPTPCRVLRELAQLPKPHAPRTALMRVHVSNGSRSRHKPRPGKYRTFPLLTPLTVAKDHQSGLNGAPGGWESK
eukprot:IDg12077t1